MYENSPSEWPPQVMLPPNATIVIGCPAVIEISAHCMTSSDITKHNADCCYSLLPGQVLHGKGLSNETDSLCVLYHIRKVGVLLSLK